MKDKLVKKNPDQRNWTENINICILYQVEVELEKMLFD